MTQPVPPPGGAPAGPSGPRADFWYRLGGFLIDGVILYVIGLVIGLVFSGNLVSQILISLAAGIAYSVYFIGSGSGQTPGMRLLSIRAVDAVTGGRVDYGRAFIRYLVGIGSAAPLLPRVLLDAVGSREADVARQGVGDVRRPDVRVSRGAVAGLTRSGGRRVPVDRPDARRYATRRFGVPSWGAAQ